MMKKFREGRNYCTLHIYEACKYEMASCEEEPIEIKYDNVEGFEVVEAGTEKSKEIEAHTNDIDENNEYLVIYFTDGTESTFRNSHVDMFNCYLA